MSAQRVSDAEANAVAASINNPDDIPTYGTKVEYNNKRFLLTMREGKYIAWDISVYDDNGQLQTGSWDVYLDAIEEGVKESVPVLANIGTGTLILGAVVLGILIFKR